MRLTARALTLSALTLSALTLSALTLSALTLSALTAPGELRAQPTTQAPTPAPAFQLAVHPELPLSALTLKDLSQLVSGRRRTWPALDVPFQLIWLPAGTPEMTWLSDQLKMPEHLMRRFVYRRVYQGTMRPPIEVNTREEALKALQRTPGAVLALTLTPEVLAALEPGQPLSGLLKLVTLTP